MIQPRPNKIEESRQMRKASKASIEHPIRFTSRHIFFRNLFEMLYRLDSKERRHKVDNSGAKNISTGIG